MNVRGLLQTTAILAVAVVAGLLAVQGTWALWSTAVPTGAQSVRAADFRVEVNGRAMVTAAPVMLENPATPLTPQTPVHATVVVRNATEAGAPFRVRAAMGQATVAQVSVPALATAVSVSTAVAPAAGGCAAANYTASPASQDIAKGSSVTFCIRVSLPPDAPETLRDATATITVPVTATQLRQGS